MRQPLRIVALVLSCSGMVGLVNNMRLVWQSVCDVFNAHPTWPIFALAAGGLLWWLSGRQANSERRSLTTPRTLTIEQRESLGARVRGFAGAEILVVHASADAEGGGFAMELFIGLRSGGCRAFHMMTDGPPASSGVRVEVSADATTAERDAADVVVLWLRGESFTAERVRKDMEARVTFPLFPRGERTAPILLTVGAIG
jgi:hypothetical protein